MKETMTRFLRPMAMIIFQHVDGVSILNVFSKLSRSKNELIKLKTDELSHENNIDTYADDYMVLEMGCPDKDNLI